MKLLRLETIRIDGDAQPREEISNDVVAQYRDDMEAGATFPAVTVFHDGKDYWLADGFHRHRAARALGWTRIAADVHRGTQRDAILHSCGANTTHGLRRSNADKRRAVERLLRDPEWCRWSDSEIARVCTVDHKTVAAARERLRAVLGSSQDAAKRFAKRNGKFYPYDPAKSRRPKVERAGRRRDS
jgi:ParB-like nuclease domain